VRAARDGGERVTCAAGDDLRTGEHTDQTAGQRQRAVDGVPERPAEAHRGKGRSAGAALPRQEERASEDRRSGGARRHDRVDDSDQRRVRRAGDRAPVEHADEIGSRRQAAACDQGQRPGQDDRRRDRRGVRGGRGDHLQHSAERRRVARLGRIRTAEEQ